MQKDMTSMACMSITFSIKSLKTTETARGGSVGWISVCTSYRAVYRAILQSRVSKPWAKSPPRVCINKVLSQQYGSVTYTLPVAAQQLSWVAATETIRFGSRSLKCAPSDLLQMKFVNPRFRATEICFLWLLSGWCSAYYTTFWKDLESKPSL